MNNISLEQVIELAKISDSTDLSIWDKSNMSRDDAIMLVASSVYERISEIHNPTYRESILLATLVALTAENTALNTIIQSHENKDND